MLFADVFNAVSVASDSIISLSAEKVSATLGYFDASFICLEITASLNSAKLYEDTFFLT